MKNRVLQIFGVFLAGFWPLDCYSPPVRVWTPSFQTDPVRRETSWRRAVLVQLVRLVLVGILLGWLYTWSAPIIYRQKALPGFWLGCAHGALMPMALPSLLMNKDVPIYAVANRGRIYKIGYICGINLCGMMFFGAAFRKPRKR